jgi:predicted RND superfamily exporter protein
VAKQGVQYLKDAREIEAKYGLAGTYSYSQEMLNYETYKVLLKESVLSIGLSLVAVAVVVFIITGSLPVTALVVFAVILVDFFLIALIYFWNLTFNTIIIVNIVIAIGLAVDYSAHIAHTYLIIKAPEMMSNSEKRVYKARKALSSMGSSVFHGGFSTFLAIISLSGSKSYIFEVFFRMWFGIIVFGMANGFLLLPVILSLCGPIG